MRWTSEVEASYKAVAETDVDAADMVAMSAESMAKSAGHHMITWPVWETAAKVQGVTLEAPAAPAKPLYCDCCGKRIQSGRTHYTSATLTVCHPCRQWKPYGDQTPSEKHKAQ